MPTTTDWSDQKKEGGGVEKSGGSVRKKKEKKEKTVEERVSSNACRNPRQFRCQHQAVQEESDEGKRADEPAQRGFIYLPAAGHCRGKLE